METQQTTNRLEPEEHQEGSKHLKAGTLLVNRYLIQGILGMGGMGAVYKARDMHFPNVTKPVAVKEMVNQALDPVVQKTIVRNFEREANLLASLDHVSIPTIFDYFTLKERSYLVLEFIEGKDLEKIIMQSKEFLPEEDIITWAIELCDVLSYLHSHQPQPIVFRDMKPSNIIITPQNHAVLVDFGIAKQFQVGHKGTMIGTEGYSPPEQYRGEATPQADIYALGATLHHALTRRDPRLEPPFSFGERPIRAINPGVSPELERIVNKALEYMPENRYQSAEEMKRDLLHLAKTTGYFQKIAPLPSAKLTEEIDIQPFWRFECEDEVRGSPICHNGVVYIGSYDQNLYAIDAHQGKMIWKYATEGGVVSRPAIYEGCIVFGSEDHRVHSVLMRTGKVNWTYYTEAPVRSSPHIAEGHAFIGSDDGHLHAINLLTGRQAWRVDFGASIRSTPTVFNDLIYFGTESGDFYCLDFSGSIKWRFQAKSGIISSPAISKGMIFFASKDATLYALDITTGWPAWRLKLGKPSISSPYIEGHLLFVGCTDGYIYCFDITTVKELWKFSTHHQVNGSPIVYKDSLYCGSVDGTLYCLEYHTGRLRWKFPTKGPITGTPVAFEDRVVFGSTDHFVYALPI